MNIQVNRVAGKLKELFAGKIDLSDVNGDKDKAFLSRSLALYGIMMNTDSDVDTVIQSLTDGYHDNGIDAVYCDDDQKTMYLIQSKWSNDGNHSISQGDTSVFISGISKLINGDFTGFNEKFEPLKVFINNAILSTDYKIRAIIIYTSNQKFSDECQEVMRSFVDNTNDGIEIISYEVIQLKDIYQSLADKINRTIMLENVGLQDYGILERNEQEIGYYGKIPVSTIANWWKEYGTYLFSKNIRYYKGDTEVNAGIKSVLMNEPENFLLFNNGIKIVADKINKAPYGSNGRKFGVFSLENASIVNGAQTTGSIGEMLSKMQESIENAYVLIQMISLESLATDMNDKITKYSNTQNRIENKDFVSLDPNQRKLQQDFAMEGIEYYYKSGYTIKDEEKSCSIDDVAIAIGCGLSNVALVGTIKSNYGKIFEKIDKPPYTEIFGTKYSTYFIWNNIQIYRIFESINTDYQKKSNKLHKLISVHGNRFLLHIFLNVFSMKNNLNSCFLTEIALDDLRNDIRKNLPLIIDQLVEIKNKDFTDSYPANIFKNGKRCEELFEKLSQTDIYISMQKQDVMV
ncbi:AIPR family protein [Ruminococcus albus]|uniref:Abortive phage infection n=1 Tax=Ruminococcus albus (strain ATCC 27210 / DSM 20455 / JCM 14654 / NCDO 2250 / 7) TaxID=697329 RepID=E6UHH0_RUMA7|nr:AIPR family protein [Ruminococcus albus]ADU21215.1 Abortive phage infection [Ruminococcus albus 7 = DSM 20455]